jgi:hypothetical protein
MRTARALVVGLVVLAGCGGRSSLDMPEVIRVLPDGALWVASKGTGAADGGELADGGDASELAEDGAADAALADGALIVDAAPLMDVAADRAPPDAAAVPDATEDALGDAAENGGDASSDATVGDAAILDAGPDADAATVQPIACGAATCNAATEECCLGLGGGAASTCAPIGGCTGGVPLSCSGSASCTAGDVCCLTLGAQGPTATCQPTCNAGVVPSIRLCGSNADCATGERCRPTAIGIAVCVARRGAIGGGGAGGPGAPGH